MSDPSERQFYINTSWHARPDDVLSISRRIRHYLDAMRMVDVALSNWRFGDELRTLALDTEDLSVYIRYNIIVDEEENPDSRYGYTIDAASDDERQVFYFLTTPGCTYSWPLANELFFKTDGDHPANTSIVTFALMKGVVLATIAAWAPDFCAAYSSDLEPDNSEGLYRKAWMTYVAPAHAASIDLVGVPFSDTTPDGGLLLSATDQTFDASNSAHIAGAQRIHEATRHLDATMPSDDDETDT